MLLAFKVNESFKIEDFRPYFKYLSSKKSKQIENFYFDKDKLRCFFSHMLLHYGIEKQAEIKIDNLDFNYNEYGKPSLNINHNIHFNISHSGYWVVCAFSNDDVGVDVEIIKNVDLKIVDRYFSKEEIYEFNTLSEEEQKERFFDYWTLKESFIKNIGKGLYYELSKFSIILDNDIYVKINNIRDPDYFFKQYYLDDKHKLSICLKNSNFPEQITFLKCEELLDGFDL